MRTQALLRQCGLTTRLSQVVDIGANPIDGAPPYADMLRAGLCEVIGFEPQPEALDALRQAAGPHERYLPYVVGSGDDAELFVTSASGMTSTFEPDPSRLALFNGFSEWGRVVERLTLATIALDAIAEIEHIDLLKMDVQGGELCILQHGRQRLSEAVLIQVEVSFVPLYKHQPGIGELDMELRSMGFLPHALTALKKWPLAPVVYDGDARKPMHQLLEADMVYVRDLSLLDELSDEQLMHLALLADAVYASTDLAHLALVELVRRDALAKDVPPTYLQAAHPGR